MALTLRLVKGSKLTHQEMDNNFNGLANGSLINATSGISTNLVNGGDSADLVLRAGAGGVAGKVAISMNNSYGLIALQDNAGNTVGSFGESNDLFFRAEGTRGFIFCTGGSVSTIQAKISHTASATRYVTLTGSNGSNPTIDVSAGALKLSAGTSDIQWGKALVALGGGSTATLGTVGGSGPATVGQNTWMRVLDSTGSAFWVPAWK